MKYELIKIFVVLILSMNSYTSIFALIILGYSGFKSIPNALISLLVSFLLSNLNFKLFHFAYPTFRSILNVCLIIYIVTNKESLKICKKSIILKILFVYSISIGLISIIKSWLPLISIFKLVYFSLGFASIIIATQYKNFNFWFSFISLYMKVILYINVILSFTSYGYTLNKNSLNGIFSNPNMLGIFLVLSFGVCLYESFRKLRLQTAIDIVIIIMMVLKTNSRTSLICICVMIIYYIFLKFLSIFKISKKKASLKLAIGIILCTIIASFYLINFNQVNHFLESYFLKGQNEDNILVSREGQVEIFKNDFYNNPILGVGFGIDNANGRMKCLKFALSYPIERGNLIFAILSETGIIGGILFVVLLISVLYEAKLNNSRIYYFNKYILLIPAFLISMGEMTFFSANSIGVLQWFLIGIFVIKQEN